FPASFGHISVFPTRRSSDLHDWIMTLAELEAIGARTAKDEPKLFEELVSSVRPDHLAGLVYTSGTTGRPKGVRLNHSNWLYQARAMKDMDDELRARGSELISEDDVQYLWLPLSHVFGKVMGVSQLQTGFTTAVDGRVDKIMENLSIVRPTFMAAAPRVFEKVYKKVVLQAKEGGTAKYAIFRWAAGVADRVSRV